MIPASFWRGVSALCSALERGAADAELRRAEAQRNKGVSKDLFLNRMDVLFRTISKALHKAADGINRKTVACTNDIVTVVRDYFDKMQIWVEHSFTLFENSMKVFFEKFNADAERRHKETLALMKEQNDLLITTIFNLYKYMEAKDNNVSDQYVKIIEHLHEFRSAVAEQHEVNYKTTVGCHEHIIGTIQQIREHVENVRRPIKTPGLTLPLIDERADNLIDLGVALRNLRDNDIPPSQAKLAAIRAIRSVGDFPMLDVEAMLEKGPLERWGLVA